MVNPLTPTHPTINPLTPRPNPPSTNNLISILSLTPHPEGGFFRRLHVNSTLPNNPLPLTTSAPSIDPSAAASSSIHYLLTPESPIGHFHRNKHLTYHFWHRGRGRYVLIRETEGGRAEVETFKVGPRVEEGERTMWVVEGGVWKASFIEDDGEEKDEDVLWISEVVVPGWTPEQHEFLGEEGLRRLVGPKTTKEWASLVRKETGGVGKL